MKYQAILFDVSDTLIEYSPNYSQIYGERFRGLNFDVSEKQAKYISKVVNWTIGEQQIKEQCGSRHLSEKELNYLIDEVTLSIHLKYNDNRYKDCLKELNNMPLPKQELAVKCDVFTVLNTLKSKYRLGIVSNHYTWLMDFLNKCSLSSYFETIIISEIVGVSKPDIRIMQYALDALSLSANQCLYVGDQPIDVLCSKKIGMDCAWITEEEKLPDYIPYKEDYRITNILDVLNILKIKA